MNIKTPVLVSPPLHLKLRFKINRPFQSKSKQLKKYKNNAEISQFFSIEKCGSLRQTIGLQPDIILNNRDGKI